MEDQTWEKHLWQMLWVGVLENATQNRNLNKWEIFRLDEYVKGMDVSMYLYLEVFVCVCMEEN